MGVRPPARPCPSCEHTGIETLSAAGYTQVMVAKELLDLQRQSPFAGLRIHVSDGHAYEVRHPEMMLVTRTLVVIALPNGDQSNGDDVPERKVYCDPVHITQVEPLSSSA